MFACRDQSYTTAVTQSTFPNMHTFLRGREFCLMLRKLRSSCLTSKNITLDEQYPGMCRLIGQFGNLYAYIREMYGPLKNCTAAAADAAAATDEVSNHRNRLFFFLFFQSC